MKINTFRIDKGEAEEIFKKSNKMEAFPYFLFFYFFIFFFFFFFFAFWQDSIYPQNYELAR